MAQRRQISEIPVMTTTTNMTSQSNAEFAAPWGKALRVISVLSSILLVASSCIVLLTLNLSPALNIAIAATPLIILTACAACIILGYETTHDSLLIKRPGWTTRIPLTGLRAAEIDPAALTGSIRLCGNGGIFSFTGLYWSKKLGRFRAYVTDLNRSIVLKFADRTIVISPDAPADFLADLRNRACLE